MERGKALPTVAVGASLLYQNLLDDDAVNGVLFATVTVPISDWWSNSYSTAKFDLKAQKAAIDEAENKNLIKVDIEAKWNSLNESYKQIEISRDAVSQAEENLRIQRDFFITQAPQRSATYSKQKPCGNRLLIPTVTPSRATIPPFVRT